MDLPHGMQHNHENSQFFFIRSDSMRGIEHSIKQVLSLKSIAFAHLAQGVLVARLQEYRQDECRIFSETFILAILLPIDIVEL
jgi:hypothetical protein